MKNLSKMTKYGLAFALSFGLGSAFAVDACKDEMPKARGSEHGVNGNQTGTIGGTSWGFEQWSAGGSNSMSYYDNGTFKASWNNNQDYLARVGFRYGDNGPGKSVSGMQYTADYKYTKTGSAQYGYIGIYGWTVNPQVEYYIVDDWYSKPSEDYIGPKQGEITVDGATYTIHTYIRDQEASKTGTSTFLQIFSVRPTPRQCGHISIQAHFDKWNELFKGQNATLPTSKRGQKSIQLKFGNVTEVMLMTEAGGGATGSVDYTYFNMSDNGEASPVTSSTSAMTPDNGNTGDAGAGQGAGQGGFNFGGGDGGQGGFNFGGGDGGQGGFNFGDFDWSSFGQGGGDGGQGGFNFDFGGGQGGFNFGGGQGGGQGAGQGGGQGGNSDFSNFDWGGTNTGDQTTTPTTNPTTTSPTITPVDQNGGIIAALPSEMKMSNGSKVYRVFNATGRYMGTLELASGSTLSEAIFAKFGKAGIYMVKSGSKTMTVKVAH